MKRGIFAFILSIMVLLPRPDGSDSGGLKAAMDAYEKYLYWQMERNIANEQKAVEEAVTEEGKPYVEVGYTLGSSTDSTGEVKAEILPDAETVETAGAVTDITQSSEPLVREITPIYTVNGVMLREDLQEYLYRRLCEAGIGWFYKYSLLIAYQESNFDILAQNPNGRDKGLFQYRIEYYPGLDWRNPYAEADVFIQQMANRAYAGCTIPDMISRHNQSDYGSYCQAYVDAVMQWETLMVKIQ